MALFTGDVVIEKARDVASVTNTPQETGCLGIFRTCLVSSVVGRRGFRGRECGRKITQNVHCSFIVGGEWIQRDSIPSSSLVPGPK
jgi:hypothetical protein